MPRFLPSYEKGSSKEEQRMFLRLSVWWFWVACWCCCAGLELCWFCAFSGCFSCCVPYCWGLVVVGLWFSGVALLVIWLVSFCCCSMSFGGELFLWELFFGFSLVFLLLFLGVVAGFVSLAGLVLVIL